MSRYAVIVVDMLNDFVTGALGCERGRAIVPELARLLKEARAHDIPVIYANDSHLRGIDHELKPEAGDHIVPKRRYSAFYQTDLQMLLSELGVDTVIVTGLHAHMCCRHTSADAYYLAYGIVVPRETTDSFTEEDYLSGLKYQKEVYGADVCGLGELIARF